MTGRTVCPECESPVLKVFVKGRPVVLDWPHHEHGDYAVEHTAAGSFQARYLPVGEPLTVVERRYRAHLCGPQPRDLSEPLTAGPVPPDQVQRWKQAVAAHNAAKRNQRVRRPGKAAVAIEWPGMFVKPPPPKGTP